MRIRVLGCSGGIGAGARTSAMLVDNDVLIDAPPVGLEVQFDVDVYYSKTDSYRKLGDVSPVVNTLAKRQFDDFVKQVRVFVAPELSSKLAGLDFVELVLKATQA